jgi:hypothetical protein
LHHALTYRPGRTAIVLAASALIGVVAALGGSFGNGTSYAATVSLRALSSDPACIYYTCPSPIATATGYPLVSAQSNEIQSAEMARRVNAAVPGAPSVRSLMNNVYARSDGNSQTLFVTYEGRTPKRAQDVAFAYAQQYALWASQQATAETGALQHDVQAQYEVLSPDDERHTARGRDLATTVGTLTTGMNVYGPRQGPPGLPERPGAGPGSPILYATSATQLPVATVTADALRTALMGAAAGLVVGTLILMLLGRPGGRRPAPASALTP